MHIGFDVLALLLAVETGIGVAVGILLWQRRDHDAGVPLHPVAAAEVPVAIAAPDAVAAAEAAPEPTGRPAARPDEGDEDLEIEDGRTVRPTALTLVWLRAGAAPERYGMTVDSASRDGLVFGGMARRLDMIQIVPARRLFHTMRLPQERLLAVHDAGDNPIDDMRGWLAALPELDDR